MATTTLLQRHAGEGETIAEAIRDCLDYGKDPEKTYILKSDKLKDTIINRF